MGGINPSNSIAQRMNPESHVFQNLARHGTPSEHPDVDETIKKELLEAGIDLIKIILLESMRGEVPTTVWGESHRWLFKRAWYYYTAEGPGIPPDVAEEFHKEWGTQCRVAGDCTCSSPLEWKEGFAVSNYHIDTQEGLNAFVKLLARIHKPKKTQN